jgi:hypothetical protein
MRRTSSPPWLIILIGIGFLALSAWSIRASSWFARARAASAASARRRAGPVGTFGLDVGGGGGASITGGALTWVGLRAA